ncbi:ABC transporter permease [Aneurinibacillus tyrosinisolvens]|uniref:ABC transporter permease n=1 Tax=Aneurinibacillus tyrosinisolvens TaxID=1443435 RepID=UPI00063FC4F4|nr:ABC transporter permease subunit [Aneurinibacillus tyrosinisolvens]
MWVIAKLSCKEILYKRIFLITALASLAFLLFYAIATHFAAGEVAQQSNNDVMMRSFYTTQFLGIGLYFAAFITALLAILSSVSSISGEIESHQIDTWLARPLPRRSIILGKFAGLSLLLALYAAFLFSGIISINQLIGGEALKVDITGSQFIKSLGIFMLEPVILVAVALFFSSMITTINGGVIMIILYGISFIGGFVEQFGVLIEKPALQDIGIASSLLFPVDSLFRKMMVCLFDTADSPFSFAAQGMFGSLSEPSGAMMVYTALYAMTALWLAVRNFTVRDV